MKDNENDNRGLCKFAAERKAKNAFEIALKAENGHVSNAKFRLSLSIALKTQSTEMFEKERVILGQT